MIVGQNVQHNEEKTVRPESTGGPGCICAKKITDEFPNKIDCGLVKIKPNIREFTESGIIFEDGSREDDVDLVVFATGYSFYFPFLDLEDLGVTKEVTDMMLYKHIWFPDMPHHTLVLLNAAQYAGAGFPNTELQSSRLAAGVFKGDIRLPSPEKMKAEMALCEANLKSRRVEYLPYMDELASLGDIRLPSPEKMKAEMALCEANLKSRRVEYLPYMDELASLVGCKPNLAWYLITDTVLFLHLLFGPGVPYQYRLHGPNIWPEARNAILTVVYIDLKNSTSYIRGIINLLFLVYRDSYSCWGRVKTLKSLKIINCNDCDGDDDDDGDDGDDDNGDGDDDGDDDDADADADADADDDDDVDDDVDDDDDDDDDDGPFKHCGYQSINIHCCIEDTPRQVTSTLEKNSVSIL
ncbi:dimethylaniline monooxygenase [n-oxide-forming] [Plakobranchus ocellatus]|uniref:Flavin-containing monooxygenase n=1 Tax=Plakobranchus ocellatus TaxID=259542 RepID=A0AAV4D2Z9_9GAST|nr:dimethylaniline monooxygenase [n-oxide-forming] [Plakobranchus ocellatus]